MLLEPESRMGPGDPAFSPGLATPTDNAGVIGGRARRRRLFSTVIDFVASPILISAAGLTISMFVGPPMSWFLQIVGTLGLWGVLGGVIRLSRYVVEYALEGDLLWYRRLGRRGAESLRLADVTDVMVSQLRDNSVRLAIRSHDAHSLIFDSACLPDVAELELALRAKPQTATDGTGRIAGGADAGQKEADYALRNIVRTVCFSLTLAGIFLAGIGLARMLQGPGPRTHYLGLAFIVIGVGGFWYITRARSRYVTWFECEGNCLRVRLAYERHPREISLDSLRGLDRTRKKARRGRMDWLYRVHLEQGQPIVLDDDLLSNLPALVERLTDQWARWRGPLPKLDPPRLRSEDALLAERIGLYLGSERLVWVGAPGGWVRWKLALRLLGAVLLTLLGTAAIGLILWVAVHGNGAAAIASLPALVVTANGATGIRSSRRSLRAVARTVYAVTDARAIILGGLVAAPLDSLSDLTGNGLTIYEPADLIHYEAPSGRQDVILDGFWQVARRRQTFRAIGFIGCPQARQAAEALEWLLEKHGLRARRIPFAN